MTQIRLDDSSTESSRVSFNDIVAAVRGSRDTPTQEIPIDVEDKPECGPHGIDTCPSCGGEFQYIEAEWPYILEKGYVVLTCGDCGFKIRQSFQATGWEVSRD